MRPLILGVGVIAAAWLGAPALAAGEPVLLEVRVLQVDPDRVPEDEAPEGLTGLSYTGLPANYDGELPKGHAALPPTAPRADLTIRTLHADGSTTEFASGASGLGYVRADGTITYAGKTYSVALGTEQPDAPFRSIAAPKIATNPGQQGEIAMGRPVRYLEPVDGGLFRAAEVHDVFEGLTVRSKASRTADGTITIDELEVTLSEVESRLRIPELNLEVGKPTIRSSTVSAAMQIPEGMVAMIPFVDGADSPRLRLVVLVRVKNLPTPTVTPD